MRSAEPVFGAFAVEYAVRGLRVFPTGGEDGKKPLVKWGCFRKGQGLETVAKLAGRFPTDNIGIITGLKDGITAVDVDDPTLIADMIGRCGDTPLKFGTPRGGVHLLYRANGERNVQGLDGAKIDVRGVGGFINAPPSRRPGLELPYRIIEGSLADLGHLPAPKPRSLPLHGEQRRRASKAANDTPKDWGELVAGDGRNRALFHEGLTPAAGFETKYELYNWALARNEAFAKPLMEDEVFKVADSLWRYKELGKLITPGIPAALVGLDDVMALIGNADALALWTFLKAHHWGLRTEFIITPMALQGVFGWGRKRIEKARDCLIAKDFLTRTHEGGRKNDPHLYAFGPSALRGSNRPPIQQTPHPPPLLSLAGETDLP